MRYPEVCQEVCLEADHGQDVGQKIEKEQNAVAFEEDIHYWMLKAFENKEVRCQAGSDVVFGCQDE